jgi:hypothetical protein
MALIAAEGLFLNRVLDLTERVYGRQACATLHAAQMKTV